MKKVIIFIVCLLVVIYATVAIFMFDFSGISSTAKADDWMIMQYMLVDNNGDFVKDTNGNQVLETKNIPLYVNKDTGTKETKAKTTKFESAKLFTYPGYDFDAWWIGGTRYEAGAWLPAGLTGGYLEVLSSWTPKLFQVTFDPMGGSPTPSRTWVRHGDQYDHAISANSFITRKNNTFNGWWTTPTGGVRILPTSVVEITENTTLYAHWTPVSGGETTVYTINYYGNGATGGIMASQSANAGTSVSLNKNTFTRTNFQFDGWATTSGGGIVYADQATLLNLNSSWNLYAVWSPVGVNPSTYYTVSFSANGGSTAAPASITVEAEGLVTLPNYNGTRSGYTFAGWNTNSAGTGTNYIAGTTYILGNSCTLYAKWDLVAQTNYVTVSFSANGGNTAAPASITVEAEGLVTLPHYNGTRSGYTFAGWNTNSAGTGTNYIAGTTYILGNSCTLYAKWDLNAQNNYVTVAFNANGGSTAAPASITVEAEGLVTLPNYNGTRSGYKFAGWNTNSAGTGTTYNAGTTYILGGSCTLYAKWVKL